MGMLLSREEMSFAFGGAQLDPVKDKELIEWILAQFLYGEMTGIQCGHWLFHAPDVESARFLARQSLEEMQHVDNFLRMLQMMNMKPQKPHSMVRFLTTGMMGHSWAEHVALEMAAGEGFVLVAFYAFIDTLNHQQSVNILNRAVKQEERHVEFGEKQTMKAVAQNPSVRRRLVGLNLVSLWGVKRLGNFMRKRLPANHPVLSHLPEFLLHTCKCAEVRLQRMGLIDRPLAEISSFRKFLYIAEAYGVKIPSMLWSLVTLPLRLIGKVLRPQKKITDTYLRDPYVTTFTERDNGNDETQQAA